MFNSLTYFLLVVCYISSLKAENAVKGAYIVGRERYEWGRLRVEKIQPHIENPE